MHFRLDHDFVIMLIEMLSRLHLEFLSSDLYQKIHHRL